MLRFRLRLEIDRRYRYYLIEQIFADNRNERFKITGKDRFILIENNRPLIRGKGLKSFPVAWEVIEGGVRFRKGLDPFISAIMKRLEG